MSKQTVAVLTTSRADYGLLYWTMRAIARDRTLRLAVIACGSHLDPKRGNTVREIERDGFHVAAKVKSSPLGDDPSAVARALGPAMSGFAVAFKKLRPRLLLVLGDRWELLAACSAAVTAGIPIAHLHGGESSEGAIDEQVRHAVTKLSQVHFPAAAPYKRRILQMGEAPNRVFMVGAPALENLRRLRPMSISQLEARVNFALNQPFAVVTCHPETAGHVDLSVVDATLGALDKLGLRAVLTLAGADAGGNAINRRMREWSTARRDRAILVASLGREIYPNLLRRAAVVIGNSSSGLSEAPSLRVPTVNVGDRQKGRLRAPSVIDCLATAESTTRALRRALSPAFRRRCDGVNPYGAGDTSSRIVAAIKSALRDPELPFKSFHDLRARTLR